MAKKKVGRKSGLNERTLTTIVETIREGAFDWVAAEAAGIGRSTFYLWKAKGKRGLRPYTRFCKEVEQARAQARIGAERIVRAQNPLSWLRLGPGRERRGEPGWTAAVEAQHEKPEDLEIEDDPKEREELTAAMIRAWGEDGGESSDE